MMASLMSPLQARGKVSEIINGAIMHYRDDLDLQNLIDFGQKEVCGVELAGQAEICGVGDVKWLLRGALGSW